MVAKAQEVVLELSDNLRRGLNWNLFDPNYREQHRSSEVWKEKEKEFLLSIAHRIKWEWVREEKVVAKGITGNLGEKVVYELERSAGLGVRYDVISTKPDGDVVVVEQTKITVKEAEKLWRP